MLYLNDPGAKTITAAPVVEADHGRIETRTATVSTDIAWLIKDHQWPGLAAAGKVGRIRETGGKTTSETVCYLLSAPLTPERFRGRSSALGRRKSAALATRCHPERGSGPKPFGKRPAKSRRSSPHGPERHAKRG